MRLILAILSGTILVILGVILFRTTLITSRQITVEPAPPAPLDVSQAAKHLAVAIRYKTISYQDHSRFDGEEFLRFHQYLEQAFPRGDWGHRFQALPEDRQKQLSVHPNTTGEGRS